jgi:hypothetical protein
VGGGGFHLKRSIYDTCHGDTSGERRCSFYSFTTSALDGGEWSASRPGKGLPVSIGHEAPETVWIYRPEKSSLSLPGIEPRSPGRPVHSQTLFLLSYSGFGGPVRYVFYLDSMFSQPRLWKLQPFGMYHCVVSLKLTDVSEARTETVVRAISKWGSKNLWNVGILHEIIRRNIPED